MLLSQDSATWTSGKPDDLRRKFVRIMPVVEFGAVWFQRLQFGVTLFLINVLVAPPPQREEFAFIWDNSDMPSKAVPSKRDLMTDAQIAEEQAILDADLAIEEEIRNLN